MDGVIETAKERFEKTLEHYSSEYERGEEDVSFALGHTQWDEAEKKRRQDNYRPALTENHCMPFVEQVVNTAREMRPSVKVAPVDDMGDQDTAEVYKGLIRNIERQSKASVAYDAAVQNSVMAGYGWIRINTDYSDPLSFDQEIKIEAVPDWRSAMIDPASEMIDGSDAEYGFIYKDIPIEQFKESYPDVDPVNFEDSWRQGADKDETVRIVEYFYKEYETTKIYECFFQDGKVKVLTESQKEEIEAQGFTINVLRERETKIHKIKWCKLSGNDEPLEKTEWLGRYIPLIPVYGKLIWDDGRLKSYSLITHAKDPQRMLNVIKTTIAEVIGSQPKNQPYIMAEGQEEADGRWEDANTENYPYLTYRPTFVTDETTGQSMLTPPPQKAQPAMVPPALFQIEANANMGIKAALGIFDESRGDESNAISGVAVRARQIKGDKATFHFIDNLACSIRHVGIVLIDLIPKLYNRKQVLRIIGNDDKEKTITIDPNGQTDKTQGIYNLGAGKYDVDIDVGPSYATQQQEFLDVSKELLRVQPEYATIAGDKIVEATGGAYADVIAERIRANMPPEFQSDDPMAMKVLELMKQLDASKQELETALIALDTKKKNEEFANQIDAGELRIKAADSETKRLETLAKIEEMKQKSMGAQSEALADISEAVMELASMLQENKAQSDEMGAVIDLFLQQEEARQATTQPEGDAAAQ